MSVHHFSDPEPGFSTGLDPFDMSRTISMNWDVSEIMAPAHAVRPGHSPSGAAAAAAQEAPAQDEHPTDNAFEAFPEPRTMPGKWDLSEMA